jgi:hypothetical protein
VVQEATFKGQMFIIHTTDSTRVHGCPKCAKRRHTSLQSSLLSNEYIPKLLEASFNMLQRASSVYFFSEHAAPGDGHV